MTKAVTHQGEPSLHQIGADGRRRQAGEQRGQQGTLHEVQGEQAHPNIPWPGSAAWMCPCGIGDTGGWQRAVVDHEPGVEHDATVDQRRQRTHVVQHQQQRPAGGDEGAQGAGERLLADAVDSRVGLVEDEQVWPARRGPGDQHPLLLPPESAATLS